MVRGRGRSPLPDLGQRRVLERLVPGGLTDHVDAEPGRGMVGSECRRPLIERLGNRVPLLPEGDVAAVEDGLGCRRQRLRRGQRRMVGRQIGADGGPGERFLGRRRLRLTAGEYDRADQQRDDARAMREDVGGHGSAFDGI